MLTGTLIGGRFVLEELAGSGGMGEVYRARDRETSEQVAVKILHSGGQAHVDRFLREARVLSQLEHPGIVRYVAHGDTPALYLAMEWLEGEDLGHAVARAPFGVRDALDLTRRVAAALDAAHRRGVVHRDIKPSNIFLRHHSIEHATLLDFGIARVSSMTRAMTLSGQVLGTIGYMAPELARDQSEVLPSADVFSLGCVLFECLTGRPAFAGDRLMAVLTKVLMADLPRVSDMREDVAPAVDHLVLRMMYKAPEKRPGLPALIAELDTLIADPRLHELRPSARVPRRKRGPEVAVGADEQRLMAVVVLEHGLPEERNSASPTLSVGEIHGAVRRIEQEIAPFGGRLDSAASGKQLVVLAGSSTATDLAAQAARLCLRLRQALPGPAIAAAVGRGDIAAEKASGEVLPRSEALLAIAMRSPAVEGSRPIVIDRTMAGLLDAAFSIRREAGYVELVVEGGGGTPPREVLGGPVAFVGRDRELSMLSGVFEECVAEPIASAVLVTAPAGRGKSRLARELVRSLEGRDVAIWTTRAHPSTRGVPLAMLSALVGEDAEGTSDPEHLARAWANRVAAECAARPLLVVLEDLHFGDLQTVRLVESTLRSQSERPFMVLALGRSEVLEQFPDLWSGLRVQHLRLPELTPRAARQLVLAVLGERDGERDGETRAASLVKRAAGNPFYLEELVRAAAEGADAAPETVLAMVQSELEQLAPDTRRVLRAASIFGESFWAGGVATLTGMGREEVVPLLEDLVRRELVTRAPASRYQDEEEFSFRHALVRETAYAALTERDRQQAHTVASAWLEAAGERDAVVMAEHLERGGEPAGAVVWYMWAAEQAFEANDHVTVIARAQRGIACGATSATLGELLLLQAEAIGCGTEAGRHAELASEAMTLLPPGSGAHARAGAELAVAGARLGDAELLARASAVFERAGGEPMGATHAIAAARAAVELYGAGLRDAAEPIVASIEAGKPAYDDEEPVLDALRAWLRAVRALFSGRPEVYAERGAAIVLDQGTALERHGPRARHLVSRAGSLILSLDPAQR